MPNLAVMRRHRVSPIGAIAALSISGVPAVIAPSASSSNMLELRAPDDMSILKALSTTPVGDQGRNVSSRGLVLSVASRFLFNRQPAHVQRLFKAHLVPIPFSHLSTPLPR